MPASSLPAVALPAPAHPCGTGKWTRYICAHGRWLWLLLACFWAGLSGAAPARAQPVLWLQTGTPPTKAWPYVHILSDPSLKLGIEEVMDRPDAFEIPDVKPGSLGVRTDAVWLRVELQALGNHPVAAAVSIDYALLNEVDVYLVHRGNVVQRAAIGNMQPIAARPLLWRTPAMNLPVTPGERYELYIRVRTGGGMIVPLFIGEKRLIAPRMLGEQMVQGMSAGLAICLLVYSLWQWISLRQRLFLYYALLVLGSGGFSVQFFGIGGQFLWGDNLWMEKHIGSLCGFLGALASFLFMGHVLDASQPTRRFIRIMQGCALLTGVLGLAFALDLMSVRVAMTVLGLLGPMPSVLSVPLALRQARRGDPLGSTLLYAWAAYLVAAVTLGLLVHGKLPANVWTLHAFQAGTVLDMLLFMRMLGLRTAALRLEAQRASRERDAMQSLAHTDPLTGLPNRRGLDKALEAALPRSRPGGLLALYMLDLDDFKPVNDRFGHDVGDHLLVAVTARLREHLRNSDTVARVGGDEFVVMACELPSPDQAHELGCTLLEAFRTPFRVGAYDLRVGLTIGYALAPTDAADAATLIKLADAAMYSGKHGGRFCLRRNTGVPTPSAA